MDVISPLPGATGVITITGHPVPKTNLKKARYFFVTMAVVFFVITAIGFGSDYIAISSSPATVHWFALIHGNIMAPWLLVFLVQSLLAAS